ncbi:MAG: hypothetical protein ACM3TR_04970 [Caulobacteraceae bacterium]
MKQVIENLRSQEYVNAGNVEAIRKYIRVKYPNSSKEELSAVFADALHKIIDTRIYQFEEKHRKKIKEDVLRKAVSKDSFSVNAAEVFSSCLSLKVHDDKYIDSLTSWINKNQDIPVSGEKIESLLTSVEEYEPEYIENNFDGIIDQFSESWAEDETMVGIGIEIRNAREEYEDKPMAEAPKEEKAEVYAVDLKDTVEAEWVEDEAAVCGQVGEAEPAHIQNVTSSKSIIGELFKTYIEDMQLLFEKAIPLMKSCFKDIRPSFKTAVQAAVPLAMILSLLLVDLLNDNKVGMLQYQNNGSYTNISEEQVDRYLVLESRVLYKIKQIHGENALVFLDGLHEELTYIEVDKKRLKEWLDKKNSILSDEPYFSAILETAKNYDINPLLMFAIAGQEQSFVPRQGVFAKKIANNPFNVYGSWEKYNTDIYDSSRLAASVIVSSSRGRPAYINAIRWINRKYAEDPNWWKNVSKLFAQMKMDIVEEYEK